MEKENPKLPLPETTISIHAYDTTPRKASSKPPLTSRRRIEVRGNLSRTEFVSLNSVIVSRLEVVEMYSLVP